jgi:hypothetical protein
MKFSVNNGKDNITNLMREVGYYFLKEDGEDLSFVRPLARSGYPRFHLYIKTEGENLIFNLHLDQKKPVYKGSPAHAGEHEGEIVEQEAERIKQIIRE